MGLLSVLLLFRQLLRAIYSLVIALVAFYDHVSCHPDLVVNGFKEAGIIDALENSIPVVTPLSHEETSSDDDDPFLDIHSDY